MGSSSIPPSFSLAWMVCPQARRTPTVIGSSVRIHLLIRQAPTPKSNDDATLWKDPIPQAGAPLYEIATDRVRFFDRPIETQAMRQLEPYARSSPYGSQALALHGPYVSA